MGRTESGTVLGTVGYMAPEQVRGEPADQRSDVFAFGSILYEMISGRRAFHALTAAETMTAILLAPIHPHSLCLNPVMSTSSSLERIVRHCIEKGPARVATSRYRTISRSTWSRCRESPRRRRRPRRFPVTRNARRLLLPAAILSILAALGAGLVVGKRLARTSPPSYQQVTYHRGVLTTARFAPDGQTIVYSASWAGEPTQVYLQRAASPDAQPVGLPDATLLAVSPQGEMALALNCRYAGRSGLCRGTLARAPLTGGAPRELLNDVQDADWTPDGSNLLIVHDAAGSSRIEFPPGKVLYETSGHVSHPRFSPKGDAIAFFDHALPGDDRGSVAVLDLAGRKRMLSTGWESVRSLAWSPSGDEIWFSASGRGPMLGLHAVSLSGRERVLALAPGAIQVHDLSRDGRALVTRDTFEFSALALAPGAARERDITWLEWSIPRDISPDGRTVLFEEQAAPVGGTYAVCLRKTDGSPPVRLGEGYAMALSPDGKWALSRLPVAKQPFTLLPTGAGEPRKILIEGFDDFRRALFTPDGREIVFPEQARPGARPVLSREHRGGKSPSVHAGGAGPLRDLP